jgi:hypothetical protein
MFREISADPVGKYPLVKYSYLEKAVTSASVVTAVVLNKPAGAKLPVRVLAGVVLTDIVWIPLFIRAHARLRALRRGRRS